MDRRQLETPAAYAKVPCWIKDPLQHLAMRAILIQVQNTGLPKAYMIDLAVTFGQIGDYQIDRFVISLREHGVDLFCPLRLEIKEKQVKQDNSFNTYCDVVDKDRSCKWFTWDVRNVRDGEVDPKTGKPVYDTYNEPQLRPCTQEEAQEYLDMLYREEEETYQLVRKEQRDGDNV